MMVMIEKEILKKKRIFKHQKKVHRVIEEESII
jgi:hypothetical protein